MMTRNPKNSFVIDYYVLLIFFGTSYADSTKLNYASLTLQLCHRASYACGLLCHVALLAMVQGLALLALAAIHLSEVRLGSIAYTPPLVVTKRLMPSSVTVTSAPVPSSFFHSVKVLSAAPLPRQGSSPSLLFPANVPLLTHWPIKNSNWLNSDAPMKWPASPRDCPSGCPVCSGPYGLARRMMRCAVWPSGVLCTPVTPGPPRALDRRV